MIFGINTTSDISKLLYVISRAVRRNLRQFWNITSGIYAKYHVQIMLLFVYTTTRKWFVIFTYACRYFKLSWNTTALSQSNCRNSSCSSIINRTCLRNERFCCYFHLRKSITKTYDFIIRQERIQGTEKASSVHTLFHR